MQLLLPVIMSLVAGVAIGLQNPLAGMMGQRVGLLQSAFIVHLGGAILAGVAVVAIPGGNLAAWRTIPWYALGAGGLGVILISGIAYSIPRMGVAAVSGLLVATQLMVAAWLDHYGLLGVDVRLFDVWRLLGIVLLITGAWLILR